MTGTGVAPNYVIQARCANCGADLCGCADAQWRGVVTIDRASEPGAWARHIRDTACMRDHGPDAFSSTRPAALTGDRDGTGSAPAALRVNAVLGSGMVETVKPEPVAPSSGVSA